MPRSYKIEFNRDALLDLDRLKAFIAHHNAKAATTAAKKILGGIHKLRDFPLAGRPTIAATPYPMRDMFVHFGQGGYWIRYAVMEKTITIIRIWHGREDKAP